MPRTSMSLLYTVSVVGAAVLQPALGAFVDEYGYRQAFACTLPALGLGFVTLVLAEWVRYDPLLNMGLGGAVLLTGIGLFLLRATSVAVQTIASTLVNQWFDKQRGQASAMYHLGFMAVQDLCLLAHGEAALWLQCETKCLERRRPSLDGPCGQHRLVDRTTKLLVHVV